MVVQFVIDGVYSVVVDGNVEKNVIMLDFENAKQLYEVLGDIFEEKGA